jgi:pantetheine-phosphate adenylyltransferase
MKFPVQALYPGTFDPPTLGHLNVIERAHRIFPRLCVAIAQNSNKNSIFSPAERVQILKSIFKNKRGLSVISFEDKLLVDFCRAHSIKTIVRGIRSVADYEYELQMSLANRHLAPEIDTLFLMTEGRFAHISSSIIKEIMRLKGQAKGMLHPQVEIALKRKLQVKGSL